jgi:cyclophilin family peptidyl-prolyl cis-trans isomerase
MRCSTETFASLALSLALGAGLGCSSQEGATGGESPSPGGVGDAAPGGFELTVLQVKDLGEIRIELLHQKAPKTVANFKKLAGESFYDGTTFHRVIPNFMIQGGDPNTKDRDPRNDGRGGPGYTIPDEINDTKHVRGVLSMANTGRPNTAGSQFFILVNDSPHLDGGYTAFGRVVEGMDVADRIVAVERDVYGRHGPRDRPLENVVLESVRIEPHG